MSTRMLSGILLLLVMVGGFGWYALQQQNQERVRDYANVITHTHDQAIQHYQAARRAGDAVNRAIASGERVDPEQLAKARKVYKKAAEDTRKEKEELNRVIPPAEAAQLHKDAMEFLDRRAQLADTTAELLSLAEQEMRGEEISAARFQALQSDMARKAGEVDKMAKDIAAKKDELLL